MSFCLVVPSPRGPSMSSLHHDASKPSKSIMPQPRYFVRWESLSLAPLRRQLGALEEEIEEDEMAVAEEEQSGHVILIPLEGKTGNIRLPSDPLPELVRILGPAKRTSDLGTSSMSSAR
eukprot:TRINITY_DN68309_c0_g1_i1.p1 TRINITY_DN68309_c0_g1~~TRINITY_DN68309_c0_g1_i1.p1  ORF type:complete len:119 (-),score=32.09 TRINITY_DN68309_c0_g1_i1:258-614(-)